MQKECERWIHLQKKFVILGTFLVFLTVLLHVPTNAYAQQEMPAYAKWGKLAVKEAQVKFPEAKIIDFLHEGSEVHEDSTIEKFKLWLKQSDKEFGLHVRIKYVTNTNKVVNIEFQETTS